MRSSYPPGVLGFFHLWQLRIIIDNSPCWLGVSTYDTYSHSSSIEHSAIFHWTRLHIVTFPDHLLQKTTSSSTKMSTINSFRYSFLHQSLTRDMENAATVCYDTYSHSSSIEHSSIFHWTSAACSHIPRPHLSHPPEKEMWFNLGMQHDYETMLHMCKLEAGRQGYIWHQNLSIQWGSSLQAWVRITTSSAQHGIGYNTGGSKEGVGSHDQAMRIRKSVNQKCFYGNRWVLPE